jgi:hypothetical protein
MKSTHSRRTLLQVLEKCRVRATTKMLLELHNPHPAVCSFITSGTVLVVAGRGGRGLMV